MGCSAMWRLRGGQEGIAGIVWLPLRALTDPYWVPWVPTRAELLDLVFGLADLSSRDVFYDLGAGDGRVVVEAAKRGVRKAVGIEKTRELYIKALKLAEEERVGDRVVFINDDFFRVNISEATIVYLYLLTRVNRMLAPKLSSELRIGSRIISLDFEIPGWRPIQVVKASVGGMERKLYLYVRGISDPLETPLIKGVKGGA